MQYYKFPINADDVENENKKGRKLYQLTEVRVYNIERCLGSNLVECDVWLVKVHIGRRMVARCEKVDKNE